MPLKVGALAVSLALFYVLSSGPAAGAMSMYLVRIPVASDSANSYEKIHRTHGYLLSFYLPLLIITSRLGCQEHLLRYWELFGWKYPMTA